MKVFVAGGTGAIGGYVVPALLGAGHTVTALARTPEKAAALTAQGATAVTVSLFDRTALADAFAGHDAVANLTSAIPSMTRYATVRAWRDSDRVRTEGSASVVDAALAAGVGRLVQESISMLYQDGGAGWIDEDAPVDRYRVARPCLAAEANAHRFSAAGGAGVVLRFGVFCGVGAAHSEQMFALARRHLGMVFGHPDGYLSSIHLADAASAVVAALSAPPGTFNIVDDEPVTKRAYSDILADAAATTTWLRGPGRTGLLLGERLTALTRSLRVANGRFRDATGWAPAYPSVREGWAATAVALT